MAIKHYKKVVVKKTQKRCEVCDSILTTIDMCYSNDVRKCWNCDKENKEKDLFGLGPADFKKCSANCDTSEHGACLCFIEFINKKP
jgi:hypothetical protein